MEIVSGQIMVGYAAGAWMAVLGSLTLGNGWPEVNGKIFREAPVTITQTATGLEAAYDLGETLGTFRVSARPNDDGIEITYAMTGVKFPESIDRFGLRFEEVKGLKRFYRSGFHSWDGSSFVQPDGLAGFEGPELQIERSYGVTELVPADGGPALVAGFDRHERYHQTFIFGTRKTPVDLSISTWWDRKSSAQGELMSERLLLLADSGYEEGLRRWARRAAESAKMLPRKLQRPLIGWGTWYNLYNFIDESLVSQTLENIRVAAEEHAIPVHTFLIDAGFTPELGDWLLTNNDFPSGMKAITESIRGAGFSSSFWIAPLMVGNRSKLFQAHPDWVLQNASSPGPRKWGIFYGENRLGKMRSEEYYVLDLSHPEVMDYLRTVFRTWRGEWGVDSFKIDFTYVGADWGPAEVRYHTPGQTRVELWRRFAEMVREEIGESALWIASGQPTWAGIGLADTIRIAGDVGVVWAGNGASALPLLQNLPHRNFSNHILWQIDPDAVLLRDRFHHLSDSEVQGLAVLSGMSGGVLMTSDDYTELPPERIALWKTLFSQRAETCEYPRFGRDEIVYFPYTPGPDVPAIPIAFTDAVIIQVRTLASGDVLVHLLNTSEQALSRRYSFQELGQALGSTGPMYVLDWWSLEASEGAVTELKVELPARTGRLLYLSAARREKPPATLSGE